MVHWLDGIRSLDWSFWKLWWQSPAAQTKVVVLVLAVAARDFLLWLFMGNTYLKEEDDDEA